MCANPFRAVIRLLTDELIPEENRLWGGAMYRVGDTPERAQEYAARAHRLLRLRKLCAAALPAGREINVSGETIKARLDAVQQAAGGLTYWNVGMEGTDDRAALERFTELQGRVQQELQPVFGWAQGYDVVADPAQTAQGISPSGKAEPSDAEGNRAPDQAAREQAKPALKEPPDAAIKAYRLRWIQGVPKQADIAERLSQELRRPVSQGQVSRWLKLARDFVEAGGVLPRLPTEQTKKPMPIDPERLDLGRRQDGLTERQRKQRSDDD
jgi:hypothetical protein